MIYGYIRVSTDKQTTENQAFEINCFSKKNKIRVDKWIKETISGTSALDKRKLGHLLKNMQPEDILLTTELSRLGRNLLQVMSILNYCLNNDIQVWTIKDGYKLGSDIQSKVLAFAFGLSAEIERNLISQRTRESLARLKSEGKRLGRPNGHSLKSLEKWKNHQERIHNLLKMGVPKRQICISLGISETTLYRFIQRQL
ncbi:MAG: master DNA invertase Mpi family serine-type recombinase [Alphaproteobacteria bacterium]|nr:master DNA invertase Mpi family serine-type recombinase [Alphaproteobacteria bacterium]